MKYHQLLLLLPHLILSRDPFVWPCAPQEFIHNNAPSEYHLVGIIFNNRTQHYTALLQYNNSVFFINQNDVLPNHMIIKNIQHDQIELMDTTNQVTIHWFT